MSEQKSSNNFVRNCLIVVAVVILVGSLVTGAGVYWVYRQATKIIVVDQTRVQTLAEQVIPGARCPAGYQGLGLDLDQGMTKMLKIELDSVKAAMYLPKSEGDDMKPGEVAFIVVKVPPTKDLDAEKLRADLQKNLTGKDSGDEKTLSKEMTKIDMGGKPVRTVRVESENKKGIKETTLISAFENPQKDLVIALVTGPSEGFDKAPVQPFFDGLDVSGLKEIDPALVEAEAPPTPSENPAPDTGK